MSHPCGPPPVTWDATCENGVPAATCAAAASASAWLVYSATVKQAVSKACECDVK